MLINCDQLFIYFYLHLLSAEQYSLHYLITHEEERMKTLSLLILALLLCLSQNYSLQGNWTLTSTSSVPLNNQLITLQVLDYVFKGQQVLQRLSFKGCQQMLLQSTFVQNQIFINSNSYFVQPIAGHKCNSDQSSLLNQIFNLVNSVFYFQIDLDLLLFNDPYGKTILTFKRLLNAQPLNLTGIWSMNQYGNTRTSLSVQILNNQLTLCQGLSIYNFTIISNQNAIKLTPINVTCPSVDLTKAIQTVKFFRLKNGIFDLYDDSVSLAVQLIYSTAYDPAKPLFPAAGTVKSTPTPSVQTSTQSQFQSQSISASNLIATWSIQSLFSISMTKSIYSISITQSGINLLGGCNNYSYPYSLSTTTQIISIGNATITKNDCAQSDDQLYASGIAKMYKYLISNTSDTYTLKFYDQAGNSGYTLTSVKKTTGAVGAASQIKTVTAAPAQINPFAPGTYLMLLLQRRDLPRQIVNITGNTLTYKVCDTIQQTFQLGKANALNSTIVITGGPITSNTCSSSSDLLYYSTLNMMASYSYDPSAAVVILSNDKGVQFVTLSRAN